MTETCVNATRHNRHSPCFICGFRGVDTTTTTTTTTRRETEPETDQPEEGASDD